MKITFAILMLGLVLFSEQQRFPYQFQQRVIPPWMYLDALSDRDLYSYMLARRFGFPNSPSFIPQTNAFLGDNEPIAVQSAPSDKTEELDVHSRNNGAIQPVDGQSGNARFLLNFVTTIGSTNAFSNPLQKTIYYFTTTTTTITSTTTCITSTAFAAASSTVICRKRRELLEFLSAMDQDNDETDKTALISPSNVQHVEPTAGPTGDERFRLVSSMDEDTLESETSGPAGDISARVKRFFVSTTIVTTYVFSTATTTRTLSTNLAAAAALSCRPSQFTYC